MSSPDIRLASIEIETQGTDLHLSDREFKDDADTKAEDDADPEAKQHEVRAPPLKTDRRSRPVKIQEDRPLSAHARNYRPGQFDFEQRQRGNRDTMFEFIRAQARYQETQMATQNDVQLRTLTSLVEAHKALAAIQQPK